MESFVPQSTRIFNASHLISRNLFLLCGIFIVASLLPAVLILSNPGTLVGFKSLVATAGTAPLSDDAPGVHVPQCKGPVCLDEGLGARLLRDEIYHLKNILELVDGLGRPLGQVFDHNSE